MVNEVNWRFVERRILMPTSLWLFLAEASLAFLLFLIEFRVGVVMAEHVEEV